MNSSHNSQESKRPSSSSSSSHPTSEDVEPVSVTAAFNRGTQTPAEFNNVRAPTQNNQNVNDAQEEVKNEPKRESHKRSKMDPLTQQQKEILDAVLNNNVSKRQKVESNSSNALNADQPQPIMPNVVSPVSQPQSVIQINTSSEKEVFSPIEYTSVFQREPKPRVDFTAGQELASLCLRIPNAFADGPLRAAGFYAEWLKRQDQVEESENEMRRQFDVAIQAFSDQMVRHLRDIKRHSDNLCNLSLESLLERYYGVRPLDASSSESGAPSDDQLNPKNQKDQNGQK